jgi:nucleoside-diphosphate-sugar epimerase
MIRRLIRLVSSAKNNVDGTLNLVRQAANARVNRFVFISSIKVNGESTRPGGRFSADDKASPADPYAISKWEAEVGLKQLANEIRIMTTARFSKEGRLF